MLDAIPHLDPGTFHNLRPPGYKKVIDLGTVHDDDKPWPSWIYAFVFFELTFALAVVFLLFRGRADFGLILLGGLAGILVDIFDNPLFAFLLGLPIIKQIHWLHHRVHHDLSKDKWFWGIPSQIVIIGGSLWLLLKF